MLPDEWQAIESVQKLQREHLSAEKARLESEKERLAEVARSVNEARRQHKEEHAQETAVLSAQFERERAELDRVIAGLKEEHAQETAVLSAQLERERAELDRVIAGLKQECDQEMAVLSAQLESERAKLNRVIDQTVLRDQYENERAELNRVIAGLKEEHVQKIATLNAKHENELSLRHSFITGLKEQYAQRPIMEWFEEANGAAYRNEIEVETKFVYPMLRNLGFKNHNLDVRYPISIQVGRSSNRGEADWVVWSAGEDDPARKVLFVVEAKAQNQELTTEVIYQTRSYAFALNAPSYVCTNGKRIVIYRRGVEQDICALDCAVEELRKHWADIRALIGLGMSS
jgi:hypothetical protein